jgi:SAM-dependent methyltransferase
MFRLQESDLVRDILGCGDGPAAFNAGMHQRGYPIVSVDPLYRFDRQQIDRRIQETYDVVLSQTRRNGHLFRWTDKIKDVDALGRLRIRAMREFLQDYELGLYEHRYVEGELPKLPFSSGSFDLILCSHFLFLYSDNLDVDFHLNAIEEMLRVGREVRIFPVLDANARISQHLAAVMENWGGSGMTELVTVDYEFQIGGNQMLVITTTSR